jgi:hypothetical protein
VARSVTLLAAFVSSLTILRVCVALSSAAFWTDELTFLGPLMLGSRLEARSVTVLTMLVVVSMAVPVTLAAWFITSPATSVAWLMASLAVPVAASAVFEAPLPPLLRL